MKPCPTDDPAESLHRLREQLILAQVRIMELEDVRDELAARQAEIEALLKGAQMLADQKTDALAHLEEVHADLQAQFQHMRHMQHITNEALNDTRARLAAADARLAAADARLQQADARIRELEAQLRQLDHVRADLEARAARLDEAGQRLEERGRQLECELGEARATAAARAQRIDQLDAEIRVMKASRSWRWTQMIRAIERWLARRRSS